MNDDLFHNTSLGTLKIGLKLHTQILITVSLFSIFTTRHLLWCRFATHLYCCSVHSRRSSALKVMHSICCACRCCHKHDCCYGDAERLGCHTKTANYHWTCEDREAECEDLEDKCEKFLCKCDREAAKCLRKAPFIQKYALWPDFLCGHDHPTCNIY
uniref:Phospholipase A2 group X n=1 Tax=Poecilia latipinna TaxID=48699 RepID=A0A3B3VVR8_9TELE